MIFQRPWVHTVQEHAEGALGLRVVVGQQAAEHPQVVPGGLPAGLRLAGHRGELVRTELAVGGVDQAVHLVGQAMGLADRIAGQADQGLDLLAAELDQAVTEHGPGLRGGAAVPGSLAGRSHQVSPCCRWLRDQE